MAVSSKRKKAKLSSKQNSRKKAGNMQIRHSAIFSSKQMAYQATISAKCGRQSAKAIKQIKAGRATNEHR